MTSPYLLAAARLRDAGYHPLPVMPGAKVPGQLLDDGWRPMPRWSQHCDAPPHEFFHSRWAEWPDAGVCIAHGLVVGLDIDTDRKDVAEAALSAVGPSPVRRKGSKGWMGYYRPGKAAEGHTARVRWYDADGVVCAELLLRGTQSVIPPSIHPGTGQPYRWITPDSLEDTPLDDLPELPDDAVDRLDAAFAAIGLTRKLPSARPDLTAFGRPEANCHALEKSWGRDLNDRALAAIDSWWPALDMPKSRQRGPGSWEAVPWWRGSNSGRSLDQRNPNLKATPNGIVDFGADRTYTPIDVVMAARDCSASSAADWLRQYVGAEPDEVEVDLGSILASALARQALTVDHAAPPDDKPLDMSRWAATPVFSGTRSHGTIRPVTIPSDAEFEALIPKEIPPFPIQNFGTIQGLLGEMASFIDAASTTATEAGALAVALPVLGAIMGQAYETPSRLRTNIYTVALGGSGRGKTSLINPAKELMRLALVQEKIGQDSIASGSGLLKMLTVHPSRICFLDEFGQMMQQISSFSAGMHAKQIITEFTRLYSAASTLYTGTAYASREPEEIDCPNLCLFGMATPGQFWEAFGSSSLEDGSIARYLVFPLGSTGTKDPDMQFQSDVVDGIKDITDAIRTRVTGNLGRVSPHTVPLDERADTARIELRETMVSCAEYAEANGVRGGSAILLRVVENALKIALVCAAGRNPRDPVITRHDFDVGHALARWSAVTMVRNITSHIADNQTEKDVNDVERKLKEAGDKGILKGTLKDRCRTIRKRDFEEIIDGLEDAGKVVREKTKSTKPGFRLFHADCIKGK